MMTGADYSLVRQINAERGRIAAIKAIRTWTGIGYNQAFNAYKDIINCEPWTVTKRARRAGR